MATLAFLDVDLASPDGLRLVDDMARRHGQKLARVAGLVHRLFLLRSPWAPGLRFVGAQALAPGAPDATAEGEVFSLGGCGVTLEDALASCLGEAAERLSQVERPGDVTLAAPVDAVSDRISPPVRSLAQRVLDQSGR